MTGSNRAMKRILLIDDDPGIRHVLRRALQAGGFEVAVAADGREGILAFEANPADLVVTDLVMPNQDGIETILALRKQHPLLPIIAISGVTRIKPEDSLKIASKLGANATLEKPFSISQIVETARKLLP